MVNTEIKYPIFRKYESNTSFFKIVSPKKFIEIQVMGTKYFRYEIEAKVLPDFHLINDMINHHNNHWIGSNQQEFDLVHSKYLETTKVLQR